MRLVCYYSSQQLQLQLYYVFFVCKEFYCFQFYGCCPTKVNLVSQIVGQITTQLYGMDLFLDFD